MLQRIMKKIVPSGQIARAEKILGVNQRPILAVAATFNLLSAAYFVFCSRSFGQDHRATMIGRLR